MTSPGGKGELLQTLRGILPHCRSGWHAAAQASPPPDEEVNWSEHPRFQIALAPGLTMAWEGARGVETHRFKAGDFLYLPGGAWQRVDRSRSRRFLGLVLFPTHVRYLFADHPGDGARHPPQAWRHTQNPAAQIVSALLHQGEASDAEARQAYLYAALHLLAAHLEEDLASHQSPSAALFNAVCAYVDDHLALPLDRTAVAQAFDRHPNYLSQLFTRYSQGSFHAYLTARRLERAGALLRRSQQPIKAIARAVGFSRPSHFGAVFRRHLGMTPGAYRLQGEAES